MTDLLVVTGPPGAGKSTVAALLADRHERSVLIEGDAFFAFLRRGAIEPWLPEADPQNQVVTWAAGAAAGRFAAGGIPTIYDGVLGPWSLPGFVEATGLRDLDYAVVLPPIGVCLRRVADRHNHGFTDAAATAHMYQEFVDAGIDPRHVIGAEGSAEAVADAVETARVAGALVKSCLV